MSAAAPPGVCLMIGFDGTSLASASIGLAGTRFCQTRPVSQFGDFADALISTRIEGVIYQTPAEFLEPAEVERLLAHYQPAARFARVAAGSENDSQGWLAEILNSPHHEPVYPPANAPLPPPDDTPANRWATLARKLPFPIIEMDADGLITYANPASINLCTQLGLRFSSIGEALPAGIARIVKDCCDHPTMNLATGMQVVVRGYHLLWSLQADLQRRVVYLCGTDVTKTLDAQQQLTQSAAYHQAVLESLGDAVLRLSLDGIIEYVSPKWVEILGHPASAAIGTPFAAWLDPADTADAERALAVLRTTGQPASLFRVRMPSAHGTLLWMSISSAIRRFPLRPREGFITLSLRDITHVQEMEDQIANMQQLEAIGLLAGGVAHDFNNLLTGIRGYIDLAIQDLPPNSQTEQDLQAAREHTEQAAALTRQLLDFGRRRDTRPEPLILNSLIERMVGTLRLVVRNRVNVHTELSPGLDHVLVDPGQMEQFLVTLSSVAPALLPAGGEIVISTMNEDIEELSPRRRMGLKSRRYVCLMSTFRGTSGGPAAQPEQLVDPTSATGRQYDAGVGLAMAYNVMRRFDGKMTYESSAEQGIVFRIFMPSLARRGDVSGGH